MNKENPIPALEKKILSLQKKLSSYQDEVVKKAHSEWESQGGCKTCNGSGTVVTWTTLDGPGWTEYGDCQNPQCTSRTLGLKPYFVNCSGYTTTKFDLDLVLDEKILSLRKKIKKEQSKLDAEIIKWSPHRGVLIEVVESHGRKQNRIEKGTLGLVFWVGYPSRLRFHGSYYQDGTKKVGFFNSQKQKMYIPIDKIKVIDTEPDPNTWSFPHDEISILVGILKKESPKAWFVYDVVSNTSAWWPKSQCQMNMKKGTTISLIVPSWMKNQNVREV